MVNNRLFLQGNSQLSGAKEPLAGWPPSFLLPTAIQPPPGLPALSACFFPSQASPAAGWHGRRTTFASNHQWLVPGPAPSRGFWAQPSLLKGGGLTWMEMCRHLPSSTHSGDKHSSNPESLHLRPGTDRAVHLGNKARGGGRVGGMLGGCQAPGQPDGERRGELEGCTPGALGEERRVDLSTTAHLLLPSRHFSSGCKIIP